MIVSKNNYNDLPLKDISFYGERIKKLGEGVSGSVYLYVNKEGKKYAIKKFRETDEGADSITIREISILTKLNHPNIVQIIDANIGVKNYLVMPAAKSDLKTYLKSNVTDPNTIKYFMYQLVKGLEYMHSLTVWHRDIKPDNILIYDNNRIVFTDFGLSRFGALSGNMYTVPVVTAFWRAPEIFLGAESYGPEIDIWAMGIILGEMAIGEWVISGTTETDVLIDMVKTIGGMTEKKWPGISGMSRFSLIKKINEKYPVGSLFSKTNETIDEPVTVIVPTITNETVPVTVMVPTIIPTNKLHKLGTDGTDLIKKMLISNPSKRINIHDVVSHKYFDSVRDNAEFIFGYKNIPIMKCGDRRILDDPLPTKVKYENPQNIETVIEWLYEVTQEFGLNPETFFYSRQLIDRVLKVIKFDRSRLQLLGVTALMISSKIYEIYPADINDFKYITNNSYTIEQIKDMEIKIMKTLKYQLMFPILSEYIHYYTEELSGEIRENATILGLAITISSIIPTLFSSHFIAGALVYMASGTNNFPPCLDISKIKVYEGMLITIRNEINRLLIKFPKLLGKNTKKLINILNPQVSSVKKEKELDSTKSLINESPKLSGIRLSTKVGVFFEHISEDEDFTYDTTRTDLSEFINNYVMAQALRFSNLLSNDDFANYFSFEKNKNKYIMTKKSLQRITYEIGKVEKETNATIHFNYVLPDLKPKFIRFVEFLKEGLLYDDPETKLSGYLENR